LHQDVVGGGKYPNLAHSY